MPPTIRKQLTLDVIRHGEPEGGDILRGRIDPLLTETGWQQMRAATGLHADAIHAKAPGWTHIISSPLRRCRDFAESLAEQLQLQQNLTVDPQWQEIDYGDWDGMPIKQWRQEAATMFADFRDDPAALVPPNGEPYVQFRDRILAAWSGLQELPDDSHVLLVTHGGVLRVILPTVLGMPLNKTFPLHIPFASFSRLQIQIADDSVAASLLFHNAAEHPFPR